MTPRTATGLASLSITNSRSLPTLMSIESVMPSNHLILCYALFLLPSIFPNTRVFSNESALHTRWPKYWSFSFSISPSNEHPGLISFRMDWLDLLAVQGTLKSLLQHHSSRDTDVQNRLLDSVGEGEGGMFRENSIETCILSRVKQITSPGWVYETSVQAGCTGKTQRNRVER